MPDPIVLFGGTFDPVHHGHLIVGRSLAAQRGLARLPLLAAAPPPPTSSPEVTTISAVLMSASVARSSTACTRMTIGVAVLLKLPRSQDAV